MTDVTKLSPLEIIKAVRANDKKIIKTLVRDGVLAKKIWTVTEVAEMLDVNKSTVSRWINQ